MKALLLSTIGSIVLLLIFSSCSLSQPVHGNFTSIYWYKFNTKADAYERPGLDSKKLGTFATSDTVSAAQQLTNVKGWVGVTFKGRIVWVNNPSIYPIDMAGVSHEPLAYPVPRPHSMNRAVSHTLTNGFGFGVGGATAGALTADALYKYRRHMFRVGYTYQFNGQLGKNKSTQLANYGRTVIGLNTYFTAFGAGYDFWLNDKFAIGLDGYLGYKNAFSNYSDKRFSAGGYHMIDSYEATSGYGGRLNYLVSPYFMASAGYNTLMGPNFSIYIVSFGKGEE